MIKLEDIHGSPSAFSLHSDFVVIRSLFHMFPPFLLPHATFRRVMDLVLPKQRLSFGENATNATDNLVSFFRKVIFIIVDDVGSSSKPFDQVLRNLD